MNNSRKAIWVAALLIAQGSFTLAESNQENVHEIAQSDLHDIMTDRISNNVAQIEILLSDHARPNAEIDQQLKSKALVIADATAELQRSVDLILALQPKLAIDQNSSPKFIALALKLKSQAAELESLARGNQFEALKPAQENMKATCNSCHATFRGY